jgi:hypothetical protein
MKRFVIGFVFGAMLVLLAILPAVSQTPQVTAPQDPAPKKGKKGPENLPWSRFHPAAPPYQPTSVEKEQIQAKIDQLSQAIRGLRSSNADDVLLADIEIYVEAARWKMAYPEEFFRQRTVGDTLKVLDQGLERAAQLKEGKSPWTTQKGRVVRGFRSAIDGSVQPVRVTVPDEYDGVRAFPLDVAQHGRRFRAVATHHEYGPLTADCRTRGGRARAPCPLLPARPRPRRAFLLMVLTVSSYGAMHGPMQVEPIRVPDEGVAGGRFPLPGGNLPRGSPF